MLFQKHIIVYLLIFVGCIAKAQTCNFVLKGTIFDSDENENLGFAYVKLINSNEVIQTNEAGEFVFNKLCRGNYSIQIKHFGCRDTIIEINLTESQKMAIRLPHSLNNLSDVDIMDKRLEMKKTQTETQLSPEDVQKSRGQNLGDVLNNISGLTTLKTGATISKPMVHGMQGYRLLILNNGIRQEGQQWGNEHAPEIDPFMAKKFSVIKGVSAIRYGSDAIAGVVLVEPNELPDSAGVTGELNLVGLSNGQTGAGSAMMEGSFAKLKNLSWRAQGSLKKGGSLKTPDYYLTNTGVAEKNFSSALGYHYKKWGLQLFYSQFNTTIGIFKGSHIGNLTDLSNALKYTKPIDSLTTFNYSIERPKQEVIHTLIKGLTHYHFSVKWRAKLQYAWQQNSRKEFDLRRLTNTEKQLGVVSPDMDLQITSQTTDVLVEHDNIKSYRGMFGVTYMKQINVYKGRFFIPNYLSNSYGVFATERYVGRYVEVELGLRYDEKHLQSYFFEGKEWTSHSKYFNNVTYNGGVIFKPHSGFNVFINAGSAWRAPAANELYSNGIHQGAGTIERGNSGFKSEICKNITATTIYKSKKVGIELTGYYNQFKNFIYLNPSGETELTIRGAFPVFVFKQDNVRISGIDVRTEFQPVEYCSIVLKGMVVRAWNLSINDYLIYMPSDRIDINLKFKFSKIKPLKTTYFQINNQLVAKQWRTPNNVDFAPPPSAYYLLGLEVSTELKIKKQKLFLNLSATNLLNARYREYLDRFRYYSDAVGVSYNLRLSMPLTILNKKQSKLK